MKLPKLVICFLFILYSLTILNANAQENNWVWESPTPQGNRLNDGWFFNDYNFLMVGDAGTIMKTTNQGDSWEVKHHLMGFDNLFRRIFFVSSTEGWIVGNDGIVLHTSNQGDDWSFRYLKEGYSIQGITFLNSSVGWLVGFKSNSGFIWKTTDGGYTWDSTKYTGPRLHDIKFKSDSVGYAIGDEGWVITTTDAGENWEFIKIATGPSLRSIFCTNTDTLWIAGDGGIFETTDGGNTWNTRFVVYDAIRSITFISSEIGFAAGDGGILYRTTDGGNNWSQDTLVTGMFGFFRIVMTNSGIGFSVGWSGVIYKTINYGLTWQCLTNGNFNYLWSCKFISHNEGWVGGNSVIMHTSDAGATWNFQYNRNENYVILDFSFPSPSIGWAVGGYHILKTTDRGLSWEKQDIDNPSYYQCVNFIDTLNGWLTGGSGYISKTSDGGKTWVQKNIGAKGNINNVQFITPNIGYALDEFSASSIDSSVLKTIDGGETWKRYSVGPYQGRIRTLFFLTENLGWAAGNYEEIWKTTNGGLNWVKQRGDDEKEMGTILKIKFISPDFGYAVGGDNVKNLILKTTDGGTAWQKLKTPSTSFITNVELLNKDTVWVVGYDGLLLKTLNGGITTSIQNQEIKTPKSISLDYNYPNPFNPQTTFRYDLPKIALVTIEIYDLLGHKVKTLVNEEKVAGSHTTTWNGTTEKGLNAASGIYFYRIKTADYTNTKKMILIR